MPIHKEETFEKHVQFKATDDDRRVAIGGVLIPNKVDLQGDWLDPSLIRELSDDFMARMQSTDEDTIDSVPGVMHAVFPSDHVTLVENRVLETDESIGGKTFPAGSWIQAWRFDDDELWSLVKDGIFTGYSIGGVNVTWEGPIDRDELPDDVKVADGFPDNEPVYRITAATIAEVSSVDIPAVPDAVMASVKSATRQEKNILEHADSQAEFVDIMADRGHSEDEADRVWDYLQRATDEGDGHPADKVSDNTLIRMGKSAFSALFGGSAESAIASKTANTNKEGRTLSRANQHSLFAAIDSSLDILQDGGVDHGMTRFTDRDDVEFSLDEHTARSWGSEDDENEDGTDSKTKSGLPAGASFATYGAQTKDVTPEQAAIAMGVIEQFTEAQGDASVRDFEEWLWNSEDDLNADEITAARSALSDFFDEWRAAELTVSDQFTDWLEGQQSTTNMSDTKSDEPPEWADDLIQQQTQNSKQIEEIAAQIKGDHDDDPDDPDDDDGDKGADGDGDGKSASTEPPEWAKEMQAQTEENAKAIENLAKASGHSQQIDDAQTADNSQTDRKFSGHWDKTFGIPGGN